MSSAKDKQNKSDQAPTNQNPIDESVKKEQQNIPTGFFSDEDKVYLTYLQGRLESSKKQKLQAYPEFNNKNYYQDFEENQKIATTKLPPKKNENDVIVSAGTIESKLESLLSHIHGLDLSPEVQAFDRENNAVTELGIALTDTIAMTEEIDGGNPTGDEEKKLLRQRELLTQGTVFVQEEWLKLFERKKKLKQKYKGEFKDWEGFTETLDKVFEGPSRTQLHGPNVYLGKITEYYMVKQPYIFASIHQDYSVAKTKYGKFENWQYVVAGGVPSGTNDEQRTIYDGKWRLNDVAKGQVEILLYQDPTTDEFQIIINGVPMLPIGFPLSAVSPGGQFNIVKQVLKPKNGNFAYGTAFVSSGSIKELSNIVDEMLKLMILKTRKSFSVPYVNTSGRVISKRALDPGRISMGFSADALQPIGTEGLGVTPSEFNVLRELTEKIDRNTISPQFTGQQGKSGTTATEVVELQRQSKLTLGLIIGSCTLLEKKLGYLRLYNLLENWFDPMGTKVRTVNGVRRYLNTFRKTVRETNIEGQGLGERRIIPVDNNEALPSGDVVRELENIEEDAIGKPVEMIFLSKEGLKATRLRWYIVIIPKEKESSAFFKLLFREQLGDMLALMQLGSRPNMEGLEEEFSRVWSKPRNKLFSNQNITPELGGVSPGEVQGRANQQGSPNLNSLIPGGTG